MTSPSKASDLLDQCVVIDVETTGLDPAQHAVVSVAAAPGAGAYIAYINPALYPRPPVWDEQARAINGLSDAFLAAQGAPPLAVFSTLRRVVGDRWVVGHNVRFDVQHLKAAALRCDSYLLSDMLGVPAIDTRWADRMRFPEHEGRRPLAEVVVRWLGARPDWWRAHDAASDALVTREVWRAQMVWLLENLQPHEAHTVSQLYRKLVQMEPAPTAPNTDRAQVAALGERP